MFEKNWKIIRYFCDKDTIMFVKMALSKESKIEGDTSERFDNLFELNKFEQNMFELNKFEPKKSTGKSEKEGSVFHLYMFFFVR